MWVCFLTVPHNLFVVCMIGNRSVVVHVAKYLNNVGRWCRHNCLFCMECMNPGISDGELPSIQMIEEALLRNLDLSPMISEVYIAGGEPTLRGDLPELVGMVKKYCSNVVLSTNCDYEGNSDTIDRVIGLGFSRVVTSIHSCHGYNHDYLTGVMGSFNRTLSTIKKFLSAGIAVKVNSVITALNVDEMPNMVDMFRLCDIPIEKLTLTHYMNHGNAYYHDELKFNIDEHSETVVEAIDMAEKMDYAVSFRDFPLCLDSRLIKYREDLENMYILDLCDIDRHLSSEKAPAVVKKKCRKCLLFDKCPKYLAANYQEVSI